MSSQIQRREFSQISRQIFVQYILSFLLLLVVLFGGFFGAWYLCTRKVWYPDEPLYWLLKTLEAFSPYFIIAMVVLVPFLFTYFAIRKPLRYLDDVIEAAKHLTDQADVPIELVPELADVQNELNLVREQSRRNAQLAREAEQRKNDLIVYLAHDLKTPLTSVIGYLNLLADEPQISPELRARYTGIALEKAERLEELINEFFDITRFNLTTLVMEPERTNFTRMLEQLASEFAPVLSEHGLLLWTDIAEDVEIMCDRDKLSRVMDNLLRNAVSYSYPETKISMVMDVCDGTVRVRVQNSGRTIPPEKLAHIFDQFFRVDSARASATGGAGLGLAIVKELVELHGGRILAESEAETVTFTVLLPDGISRSGLKPLSQ